MDERARRIGQNEAIFRAVNEQIEGLNRNFAEIDDGTMRIVCECGNLECFDQLAVPLAEYERIRADATLFFTFRGHERLDVESVVEERPGYYVVKKHEGTPADVARDLDPRSG